LKLDTFCIGNFD